MQRKLIKQNSAVFKALGHRKRLEIVCLLQGHQLTVSQIVQMTALRQAAVSQHLMLLKEYGLVTTIKEGKEVYYALEKDIFTKLTQFVKSLARISPVEDVEPSVKDPICQMTLTPSTASYTCTYNGVREYFCGKGCLNKFRRNHEK